MIISARTKAVAIAIFLGLFALALAWVGFDTAPASKQPGFVVLTALLSLATFTAGAWWGRSLNTKRAKGEIGRQVPRNVGQAVISLGAGSGVLVAPFFIGNGTGISFLAATLVFFAGVMAVTNPVEG